MQTAQHQSRRYDWGAVAASCDPVANAKKWQEGPLKGVSPDPVNSFWGRNHLAVHGTSVKRALSIIGDQEILSHRSLSTARPEIVADRMHNATDDLDIKLGLDRYVFLSLGRVHPFDVHPVYFLFKNSLIESPGTLVAPKEIVHFDAIVSKEGAEYYKRATGDWKVNIDARNFTAAEKFYRQVFHGKEFREELFPKFLERFYSMKGAYWFDMLYPGDKPVVHKLGAEISVNGWEGPQATVPDRISLLEQKPSILITSSDSAVVDQIQRSGFPCDRIYKLSDAAPHYRAKYPGASSPKAIELGIHVNLALRDLTCLAHHNELSASEPDSMVAFKEFAK